MALENFASLAVFCSEFIARPRAIGALMPSSSWLARRIAEQVPPGSTGYVVELGAGTGAITRALEATLDDPDRLVCVESSPALAAWLHRRHPDVHVIEGDAARLGELLRTRLGADSHVSHVVSSLPLRSLDPVVVDTISREVELALPDNGRYIQFTYHVGHPGDDAPPGFRRLHTSRVWANLPPARVDIFTPDRVPATAASAA